MVKSILDFLQPLFKDWGYFIVFGLALLEHSFMVGLVVPGDAVILLGALYAGFGDLNIVVVILLAFVGSVLGDNIGYLLGSRIGRPLIDRHGDFMRLRARVKYVEKYFKKYGGATVFIARFATFVGTLVPPVAGMSRMRWRTFIKWEVAGSAVWATGYGLIGYFFGRNEELILRVFNYIGNTLLMIFIVIGIVVLAAHRIRKRREFSEELDRVEEEDPEMAAPVPEGEMNGAERR